MAETVQNIISADPVLHIVSKDVRDIELHAYDRNGNFIFAVPRGYFNDTFTLDFDEGPITGVPLTMTQIPVSKFYTTGTVSFSVVQTTDLHRKIMEEYFLKPKVYGTIVVNSSFKTVFEVRDGFFGQGLSFDFGHTVVTTNVALGFSFFFPIDGLIP